MTSKLAPFVVLPVLLLGAGLRAEAAPVAGVQATLSIEITGLGVVSGSATGTVDVSGSTYTVPAGLVALSSVTVPVTAFSGINALMVTKLSNLSATFSLGGATGQVTGETCPVGVGEACVDGGGVGGVMALTGILNVVVVPSVTIPLNLNAMRVGQGGVGSGAFTEEAAPWTTGVARINTGAGTPSLSGSDTGTAISLVTATFVSACGNLLPVTARFTLSGVPEASTAVLLLTGAAGTLLLFLRRR